MTPWELRLKLDVWKNQLLTLASTVSVDFAEYASRMLKTSMSPRQGETRLVIVLLKVLPHVIKTPALETDDHKKGIGSLRLLEEMYSGVRPGGLEEQQTMLKLLRNLSPTSSARGAIEVLRRTCANTDTSGRAVGKAWGCFPLGGCCGRGAEAPFSRRDNQG